MLLYRLDMSNQIQQKQGKSSISKYKTVIILAILPVILALYANSVNVSEIPQTISSGLYPVAFTILSWGIAVQELMHIRKK